MAKNQFTNDDDALLAELGVEVEVKSTSKYTPREERIIAGFEDIERFVAQHGRMPAHGEDNDIFERLYDVRLDQMRSSAECCELLTTIDKQNILQAVSMSPYRISDDMDDDTLLAELGVLDAGDTDITKLTHVKPRAMVRAEAE